MDKPAEDSPIRKAVFEALRVASPDSFDAARRQAFMEGSDLVLADLGMDSLGEMEFCIDLELSTGATLLPSQLAELATTNGVAQRIQELLGNDGGFFQAPK